MTKIPQVKVNGGIFQSEMQRVLNSIPKISTNRPNAPTPGLLISSKFNPKDLTPADALRGQKLNIQA